MKGSLVDTLQYVRPHIFFAVPRIYEKFEERIQLGIKSANALRQRIAKWAQRHGYEHLDQGTSSLQFRLANFLVFNKLKKALGLDECLFFGYGAAPLKVSTFRFFKSFNILLLNFYGLSETSGPQFTNFKQKDYETVGITLPGTESMIHEKDRYGVGEICFRGRNRFMGYWKNEEATVEAIDENGFFHSGDQGYINKDGLLIITGRLKEILVTAGGENVAPIPIEDSFREKCRLCANCMVVGDYKKFLSLLITFKTDPEGKFLDEVKGELSSIGSSSASIMEAIKDPKIIAHVEKCIDEVNKTAVSNAQVIRKYKILTHDFSIETGEFTPTMKLKRKYVALKYTKEIAQMYEDPKF